MDSVVVSIRIKKELKVMLEKEGIDVRKRMKDDLTQLEAQIKLKKAIERSHKLIEKYVKPSPKGWAVKTVRHDRYVVH